MGILDSDIKQTSPKIVMVDSAYLSYLHGFDSRERIKKDRPYVGLAVRINDKVYVIPLTSQTTQERKKKGLKKRNSLTTTFVKAAGVEISDLLHNNMIPVPKQLAQRIEIDPIKDTYLTNEYRYIRKHWVDITNKSLMIYLERYNEKSRNNKFLFDKVKRGELGSFTSGTAEILFKLSKSLESNTFIIKSVSIAKLSILNTKYPSTLSAIGSNLFSL